ncbi:MAG: Hydroxymethylglutaryl-CoA synthase (EC [uncultured Aureispira sp.]|uniref:Hydroxymethylglutaryl-CoA synthase (EC) n=1 Tax=uncultured Aureispira sp. TaxID=1331704 RepID=A0A6S6UIC2_9BACT|nr:MAG: Hydroxymethylglutaryl-CoA synthase (EC [uncultured Aureispira sp.]
MKKNPQNRVGIDDMALYIPQLYLSIEVLAKERGIPFEKLSKGLGLDKIAIPDAHEDAATMAANAAAEIIERNQLNPKDIGRIYLGTESALDGAKPTATYVLEMLRRKYKKQYGVDCFQNCDVVDLTFACVGGVDALQNTLDWVRGNPDRIGIVIASDIAKYELASTGEYTQGAGAIAMLIKQNPRLLVIEDTIGVATQGVHDFFKPKRSFSKEALIEEILQLADIKDISATDILAKLPDSLEIHSILGENDQSLYLHKDTPIFDGPYSNQTYQNRIREALLDFRKKRVAINELTEEESILKHWSRMIFHLPYAAHGRRIASEIFMDDLKLSGDWAAFAQENELLMPQKEAFEQQDAYEKAYGLFLRSITKTGLYKAFVKEKLYQAEATSAQVGNMYACSIFLALMGTLEADYLEGNELGNKKLGCIGYGSGSKSKVFEVNVQPGWRAVVEQFNIHKKLATRQEIDYATYETLHRLQRSNSVQAAITGFKLDRVSDEPLRKGARYYSWRTGEQD